MLNLIYEIKEIIIQTNSLKSLRKIPYYAFIEANNGLIVKFVRNLFQIIKYLNS